MTSNPFLHLLELLEADVGGVLPEALTAHVEVVLPAKEKCVRILKIAFSPDFH